jgi:hypothetical protein
MAHAGKKRRKPNVQSFINPPHEPSQQAKLITRVIFAIDRSTGKIDAVYPAVLSDAQLAEVDPWIQACIILSDLIRPMNPANEARAA